VKKATYYLLIISTCVCFACGEDKQNFFHVDIVSYLDQGRDIEMVSMPGGAYAMGSALYPSFTVEITPFGPDTTFNLERPVHVVSVSSFLISSTEITHEQYVAIMGETPWQFTGETNMPAERVSWTDAANFCNELSKYMGLNPCYSQDYRCNFGANGFRLPTEAEWEYAARAGVKAEYYFGDSQGGLGLAGWYSGNSGSRPQIVASRNPNAAGLYDMHGNVMEACQDWYDELPDSPVKDPVGSDTGIRRVFRGGSWSNDAKYCRSATRGRYDPETPSYFRGLRLAADDK